MDAQKRNALSASITPQVISRTTDSIAYKFGTEVATDAVGTALVKTCEFFDPQHESGASASTYFVKAAHDQAKYLAWKRFSRSPRGGGEYVHYGYQSARIAEADVRSLDAHIRNNSDDVLGDMIPGDTLDYDHPELNQIPAWLANMELVDRVTEQLRLMRSDYHATAEYVACVKTAERVIKILVDLLDEEFETREELYMEIGSRLNRSPNTVRNAFCVLQRAVRASSPEKCRAVAEWRL